jgi:hypothetical protein
MCTSAYTYDNVQIVNRVDTSSTSSSRLLVLEVDFSLVWVTRHILLLVLLVPLVLVMWCTNWWNKWYLY